jgi:hypothetical protein
VDLAIEKLDDVGWSVWGSIMVIPGLTMQPQPFIYQGKKGVVIAA